MLKLSVLMRVKPGSTPACLKQVGSIFAPLLRLIWIHENTWYDLWNLSSFVVEYRGMAANANLCDPYLNTILLYSQSLLSLF